MRQHRILSIEKTSSRAAIAQDDKSVGDRGICRERGPDWDEKEQLFTVDVRADVEKGDLFTHTAWYSPSGAGVIDRDPEGHVIWHSLNLEGLSKQEAVRSDR